MMNLEAKKTDIIENILYKFCLLIKTNIELLSFYCNSQEIDPKFKIKQLMIKKNKEINIFAFDNYLKIIYKVKKVDTSLRIFGDKFITKYKDLCRIFFKDIIYIIKEYFYLNNIIKEKENDNNDIFVEIYLTGINKLTDLSYMFYNCNNLFKICGLEKLKYNKITNMSSMFENCRNLKSIHDISLLDAKNVISINSIFRNCSSLEYLPDISKWNTLNMEDISHAFSGCNSLKLLPDISKWNTNKIKYMEALFLNCSSLLYLPNISLWNTKNVIDMKNLFTGCSSLSSLPNLSKWKINQKVKINEMFKGCSSLSFIPDISKWPILLPETIYYKSSKYIYDFIEINNNKISLTNKINCMNNIETLFEDCISLQYLPFCFSCCFSSNCFNAINIKDYRDSKYKREREKKEKYKGDCPVCGGLHFNCFCCLGNCPIHGKSEEPPKDEYELDFKLDFM